MLSANFAPSLFQNEAGIRFRACSRLHLIGHSWPANRAVATNGKAKLL